MSSALSAQLGDLASGSVALSPGTITSVSPLRVDTMPVSLTSAVARQHLLPGDVVLVARHANRAWIVGVVTARPSQGVIQSVGATTAVVRLPDAQTHTLEWAGPIKPVAGQRVLITWSSDGGVIVGPCSGSATTGGTGGSAGDLGTPGGSGDTQTLTRSASAAATAKSGTWNTYSTRGSTAWQGQYAGTGALTGYYFYGGGLAQPGRTAISATITLRRSPDTGIGSYGAVTARLRMHTADDKPSSPPAVSPETLDISGFGFGSLVEAPLPLSWAQQILNGTRAGFCLVSSANGDYAAFDGPTAYAASGTIQITHR